MPRCWSGPVLDVKRKEDRWLGAKALDSMATHCATWSGRGTSP